MQRANVRPRRLGAGARALLRRLLFCSLCGAAAFSLVIPQPACAVPPFRLSRRKYPTKRPVESELVYEGLVSYGHYKIFASGSGAKLYTSGVEYDRHSWGRFLGARMDYVAEFLPMVLLDEGGAPDIWGTPTTKARQFIPGIGISPIGFRWLWRDGKSWKPYLMAKGGMLFFDQKALSQKATYENFSLQSAMGLQVKMTRRVDLRLGLFSDFHFSNAFIVPVNPGLDVMNANIGISYELGGRGER